MQNDWRSWRTDGDWLTYGQKQTLDDIGSIILGLLFVGFFVWMAVFDLCGLPH